MNEKVEISKKLLLLNSASGVVVRVLSITVLVWLQQFLLKRISTDEYSLYPILVSMMLFLPLVTMVLTSGIGRFVVEAYARGDEERITEITSTMFFILLCFCIPMLLLGMLLAWNIGDVLTINPAYLTDARIMTALMIGAFVLSTVFMPFTTGFYVRQKFIHLNLLNFSRELLRIAILFLLLFGVSTRVFWLAVASFASNIIGLGVMVVLSRKFLPSLRFKRCRVNIPSAKSLLSFGGWSLVTQISAMIRMNADPIILNKLATSLDVTCFHLGSLASKEIQRFTSIVLNPMNPQLVALHAANRKDALRGAFLRGNRFALWGALFLAVPLVVFSHELITLWVGGEFALAAQVAVLLLTTFPVLYTNLITGPLAGAMNNLRPLAIRILLIQLVNLALTIYLVGFRNMGALGSALSTWLTSIVLTPLLTFRIGFRLADVRFSRWFRETVIPGLLPALVAAGIGFIVKITCHPASLLGLVGAVSLSSIAYLGALYFFALQPKDKADLLSTQKAFRAKLSG